MRILRELAFALLAGVLLAGLTGSAAADWITFPLTPNESVGQIGEDASGRSANPVRGFVSIPLEPGRHPAVVLLPGCEGRRAFHVTWAQSLSERGYVALLVDDFFMHDRYLTCGVEDSDDRDDIKRRRLRNALAAARYLSFRSEVDRERIAVMGWGDAPIGALIEGIPDGVFSAAVAVTPERCFKGDFSTSRPLLELRAGSDAQGAGEFCVAPGDASSIEVRVYEGTLPGFDDPRADGANVSGSAERAYDRLAHVRAIDDVAAFLERSLGSRPPEPGHEYSVSTTPVVAERGTWAVDPGDPGADLPPVGASAFDSVFSRVTPDGVVHDIPFPFARLLKKLEQAAGGNSMARSPLDSTLIPLGRSLQREAAAPDYFESPRIVVAVTGAPDSGVGPIGVPLKNRLFLGYQPRSETLEIISYNDAARRFEFQVVRDYGSRREPEARYARRALCASCHQNQAPMFPDASWGETTADRAVASRLQNLGPEFHGVPVNDDRAVTAIDIAADEANLLPVYQRLWLEGCASTAASDVAHCRAGALLAMVQYRLSNSAGFDRAAPLYADGYLPVQRRNWIDRWPDGLLIPNSNLPDRAPLMSPSPSAVPVALDPLRHRPPMARWEVAAPRDLERLVRGLSRELPDRQITLLDDYLRQAGGGATSRELRAPCSVVRRGLSGRARLYRIECGIRPDESATFQLQAQFQVTPDGNAEGEASSLGLDNSNYARRTLAGNMEATESGGRIVLRLVGNDGVTAIRAPDGNAVESFTLAWDQAVPENAARFEAFGMLSIASDFEQVTAALEQLAADTSSNSPLFDNRFDGIKFSKWLLAGLGILSDPSCCDVKLTPEPRLDVGAGSTEAALSIELEHRGPLRTFSRYCGACHGSDTTYPPGFLHGDGDAVLSALRHCAERIYVRLSMWGLASDDQIVPPMPPMQGLSLVRTTADEWRRGESLERLTNYVEGMLVDEGRDPNALLESPYHATRACLVDR